MSNTDSAKPILYILNGMLKGHGLRGARFLCLVRSMAGRVLIMAYTIRGSGDDEKTRIINSRRASRKDKAAYANVSAG